VPLYLFYPKGTAEPTELPPVLTPSMLVALARHMWPTAHSALQQR
jgi:hypothetical protein